MQLRNNRLTASALLPYTFSVSFWPVSLSRNNQNPELDLSNLCCATEAASAASNSASTLPKVAYSTLLFLSTDWNVWPQSDIGLLPSTSDIQEILLIWVAYRTVPSLYRTQVSDKSLTQNWTWATSVAPLKLPLLLQILPPLSLKLPTQLYFFYQLTEMSDHSLTLDYSHQPQIFKKFF